MGNRSFLCLGTRDQIDAGEGHAFADANNNFPTLWRLLLADGELTESNTDQRVFGNAGTRNLSGRASAALARVRQLADGLRQHPLRDTQPYLDLHFDALLAHCEAELARFALSPPDEIWFSANIDELSWLDGDAPDDFVEKERQTCIAIAAGVTAALAAQDFPSLDHLLEIDSDGASFTDWRSWAWNFGFGGIDHPYFAFRDEPRTIPYGEFDAEAEIPDGDERDSWLGHGLERFRENVLTGVMQTAEVVGLRTRDVEPSVLIPAEWEAIENAGHQELPLFWVTRDAHVGLLRADATGVTLLHPCDLTESWHFERAGARRVAVVKRGERLGLLADDGAWIADPDAIHPTLTGIEAFVGSHAVATSGEMTGVLDETGAWTVAPTFVAIDDLQESGIAIARDDGGVRLIDVRTGELRSPTLHALDWLHWPGVFEGRMAADGTTGWWRADGRESTAAQWDSLELLQEKPWLVRVTRDGLCGVRDRNDRERIAPVWDSLTSRNADVNRVIPGHLEELIAGRDGRYGLIDGAGRELIPVVYDGLHNFTLELTDDGESPVHAASMQVVRATPDGDLVGAWDLDMQREIVPCEYHHLYAMTLHRKGKSSVTGYLAVQRVQNDERSDDTPLRVGILRADGTVLHEPRYAWIAERFDVSEYPDALLVARTIARNWSTGQPVQAAPWGSESYVWLHRDGRVDNDLDTRMAQFRSGDFTAAHTIACQYRDGEGVPQNDLLARRWMLLAAGQPESAFDAPAPGMFKRLLGAKPTSPLMPSDPDPRGDAQAICDLCQALINGSQDPEELLAARAWLELAVPRGHDRSRGNAEAHMLLGYLLLEGIGGPQDEVRALELSTRAAALGNPSASFNLGVMYEYGRGTSIDRARALRHYTTASKAGDRGADLAAALLLLQPASDGSAAPAKDAKQAAYHLQRAIDCDTIETAAAARTELGKLYLAGTGVTRDDARGTSLLREAAADGNESALRLLASNGMTGP